MSGYDSFLGDGSEPAASGEVDEDDIQLFGVDDSPAAAVRGLAPDCFGSQKHARLSFTGLP